MVLVSSPVAVTSANIIFNQLTEWCFTIWFYNFILKMCKSKNENDTFMTKKTEEKQWWYDATMISVDGTGTVLPVKLK